MSAARPPEGAQHCSAQREDPRASAAPPAGPHILVAEDDPEIRANLQRLLRLEGFRVTALADGRAALAAVHAQAPDLLLTDAMMPELDGEALLRLLRADPRHARLPVLLLTARADTEDHARALQAGASAVVTKPFQRAALLDCIRRLLADAMP